MEESSKEEKQQFLREMILTKNGIDTNDFVDFLKEKKGEEGQDIANWTMDDLREVVIEFYKLNNIPLEDNKDNSNNNENNKIDNTNNNNNEEIKEEVKKEEIKREIKEEEKINKVQNNNNIILNNTSNDITNNINTNNNDKKENIVQDKKEKEESIKFIIDEDSLLDFMFLNKGIKRKNEEEKNPNNSVPISNIGQENKNKKEEEKTKQKNNEQFNFDKNFNNNLNTNNNQQKFNFEENVKKNNNNINNNTQFNFEDNFKKNNNSNSINNINNNQFNFEENFKKSNSNNQEFNFVQDFSKSQPFNFNQNFNNNNLNSNDKNNKRTMSVNDNVQQFNFEKNFNEMNLNKKESKSDKNLNYNFEQKLKVIEKIDNNNNDNKNDNKNENKELNINTNNDNRNSKEDIISKNTNINLNTNDHPSEENKPKEISNTSSTINDTITNNDSIDNKTNSNNGDNNIISSNLTNFIDKNDHDSEYGIIITDSIKCKKIETTKLSNHKDLIIKISDPIKLESGFFTGKSVNYLVTTSPLKYAVRRKYSDFNWLRETLINIFNSNVIPKLAKKGKVTTDKHDDSFIQKRMKFLETFINYLIKDELIKSSQILYDFLTIQKDDDFQRFKKSYDKIKTSPLIDIKERKSINGELKIKITKEKEIYLENIKDNAIYNVNLLKKLNYNFKLLQEEFLTVIKRFESISQVYRQLYDISIKYLDQKTITEGYAQMEKMFLKLSESFDSIKKFINSDIREYFKFVGNNFNCLSEMTQNVDMAKNNYIKIEKSLINKKNDLFKRGDTSKWELSPQDKSNAKNLLKEKTLACIKMLPKETKNCINSKEIYGFYLNKLISEYERIKQFNSIQHKKKICFYCKQQIFICSDYTRVLGDITMDLDSCINKPK